jgi:DNA-binding transcriptional MerR regulator
MSTSSTRSAAKKLGIDVATLSRYIKAGKVPAPKTVEIGGLRVHSWTEADIERVRAILPKIKNGRTTRHKKQALKTQSKQKAKR